MKILCIKTAALNVVLKGHKYPLISTDHPCGCNFRVYVGINGNLGEDSITGKIEELPIGTPFYCEHCKKHFKSDGKFWIPKSYFYWPPEHVSDDNFQQVWSRTKENVRNVVQSKR